MDYNLITVLGPTATGKTAFAAQLAHRINGEVISADSRQVYRGMDIGTGKDFHDYLVDDHPIPAHLIDIVDPGYEYNVYEYQQDFFKVFEDIRERNRFPLLCGGTGLYIEAVLKGYGLIKVPENPKLRELLSTKSDAELMDELKKLKQLHNTTDSNDRVRLIRALEIARFYENHPDLSSSLPTVKSLIFGIWFERPQLRERITIRLKDRLENGMTEEVEGLLKGGIAPETLKFYGLEYRYLTEFVTGEIDYDTMFTRLNTAIHQFAKRQVTWFRRMERNNFHIHWLDGEKPMDQKIEEALKLFKEG